MVSKIFPNMWGDGVQAQEAVGVCRDVPAKRIQCSLSIPFAKMAPLMFSSRKPVTSLPPNIGCATSPSLPQTHPIQSC